LNFIKKKWKKKILKLIKLKKINFLSFKKKFKLFQKIKKSVFFFNPWLHVIFFSKHLNFFRFFFNKFLKQKVFKEIL
jgi:hypothetical protein